MIFIKIPGMGDSSIATEGYNDGNWFTADSFSFGVDREMKESGEKGGTADINIGIGELQECIITKNLDMASSHLAQFSINGNSVGTVEIDFFELTGDGAPPVVYLKYKLGRCFVESWSTSADAYDRPVEEVVFYYNKIAFQYAQTTGTDTSEVSSTMSWDNVKNIPWASHGINLGGKAVDKKVRKRRLTKTKR